MSSKPAWITQQDPVLVAFLAAVIEKKLKEGRKEGFLWVSNLRVLSIMMGKVQVAGT